jgi:hypothetical protein
MSKQFEIDWESFKREVIGKHTEFNVAEMRMAFYMGAAVFSDRVANAPNLTAIDDINQEIADYQQELSDTLKARNAAG